MPNTLETPATEVASIADAESPSIPNLARFLETLPDLTPEESEAFEQAITENRAHRRALANEREPQDQ